MEKKDEIYPIDFKESKKYSNDFYEKDIWYINDIGLAEHRINKTESLEKFNFETINNLDSRKMVKIYIKYLIRSTDLALITIYTNYKNNRDFCNFLKKVSIIKMTREHVESYYSYNKLKNLKPGSINQKISANYNFMKYLKLKKYVSKNHFSHNDYIEYKRKVKFSNIDKEIIHQIFSVLDKVDKEIRIMFLILYCTGMRVSELCQLKVDCLYKTNNKTFIRYTSQKMQKEVTNPIPETLYSMIKNFIQYKKNKHDYKEIYMFPIKPNKPYITNRVRTDINRAFNKHKIKNNDGSLYKFRPHDYRHTLGTQMLERDIPLSIIQRILHHDSIEMTLSYAEVNDKRRINKYKEFINIKGKEILKYSDKDIEEFAKVEWLRKNVNAQILPNGICTLPAKLNKCPHANSCLTCEKFATTLEYLDIHKSQLNYVNDYLVIARRNNWKRQIETNEETRKNLINIIEKLESIKGCELV